MYTCFEDRMPKFNFVFGTTIRQTPAISTSPGPGDGLKANEGIPKARMPVVPVIPEETSSSLEGGQRASARSIPLQREPTSQHTLKRVDSRAIRRTEADKALQVRVRQTKGSKKANCHYYVARTECLNPRETPSVLAENSLSIPHVCANGNILSVLISRFSISGH